MSEDIPYMQVVVVPQGSLWGMAGLFDIDYSERFGKSYKQVLSEAYADFDTKGKAIFVQELRAFLRTHRSREEVVNGWAKLGAMWIPHDLDLRELLTDFSASEPGK